MWSKMLSKIACFLEHRFGRVLGKVLGMLWEAKNLVFRAFCSMLFRSKNRSAFWKAEKSRKNAKNNYAEGFLGRPGGMRGLPGREKERDQKP